MNTPLLRLLLPFFFLVLHLGARAQSTSAPAPSGPPPSRPLHFIQNRGQLTDAQCQGRPEVGYYARGEGVSLFFTGDRVVYSFRKAVEAVSEATGQPLASGPKRLLQEEQVIMRLLGSNPRPVVEVAEQATEKYAFYYPHIPQGVTGVPAYRKLVYRDVYPQIDLVFYAYPKGIKYDFVVHPGGDPDRIRMRYEGAAEASLGADGRLTIRHRLGQMEEEQPYTYQPKPGAAGAVATGASVSTAFVLLDTNTVGFTIGPYNRRQDLIIDPFATYYGGSGTDEATAVATDASGNIFMAGTTSHTDFPTQTVPGGYNQTLFGGYEDAFVVKFDKNGVRQWATYYGGGNREEAYGLAVDKDGNAVLTGITNSTNLPVLSGGGYHQATLGGKDDAFLLKLSPSGARLWSTYYGGAEDDEGRGVATDAAGNIVLVGFTRSANFPTQTITGGYNQTTRGGTYNDNGFIVKLSPSGGRLWATYYGGNYDVKATGVAADGSGNVWVTGVADRSMPLQNLEGAYNQSFSSTRDYAGAVVFGDGAAGGDGPVVYSSLYLVCVVFLSLGAGGEGSLQVIGHFCFHAEAPLHRGGGTVGAVTGLRGQHRHFADALDAQALAVVERGRA